MKRARSQALTALYLCALTLFSLPSVAQTLLRAPRPVIWKDFLGVNVQFHQYAPQVYEKQMDRLDQLGLQWIRWTLRWPALEPQQDQYHLSELDAAMSAASTRHYRTVASLVGSATFDSSAPQGASNADQYPPRDNGIFAERMTTLAQHYPQVSHWQVWNEPNILWLPQADPAAYYELLITSMRAIRSARPNAGIVSAGVAYYGQIRGSTTYMLDAMLDQGLASHKIVAAYHPYSDYPEGDSVADQDFLSRANTLNRSLHDAGVKKVWATEWGWSSYTGPSAQQRSSGPVTQADYTLRRLALMSAMDYQRIFLFNLSDHDLPGQPRDSAYGLLDLNGEPKPVYTALANFLDITGPTLQPADLPPAIEIPDDLIAIAWNRPDGSHLLMAWSASGAHLNFPGIKSAVLHDPLTGQQTQLANVHGVDVALTPTLQILAWNR